MVPMLAAAVALSCLTMAVPAQAPQVQEVRWNAPPQFPGNVAGSDWTDGGLTLRAGMGDSDWGYAVAGARLLAPDPLTLRVRRVGEPRELDANTALGIVVDMGSPSGYQTRLFVPFAPLPEGRQDVLPPWGKASAFDKVLPQTETGDRDFTLDLADHAPNGWDGRLWLSVLVENTGRDTALEVTLVGAVRGDHDAGHAPAPVADRPLDWLAVSLAGRALVAPGLEPQEALALEKLQARLPAPLARQDTGEGPALYVGRIDTLRPRIGDAVADRLEAALADTVPWRRDQGYVIHHDADRDALVVAAVARPGLIYGISHLHRSIVETPEVAVALEGETMVEKPGTEERGIYINIGYGNSFERLSPDTWDEARWERFIDDMVLSRATFWAFYLWTEIEHIYPGHTPDWAEKNARVHGLLKHAIDYGHRRGLRAVFLFTPTNIPADMVAANPGWATTLEYVNSGGICSRVPEAYQAALRVHRHQMEYFRDVDEVNIAFYDCGGCMCEECRKGDVQLGELLKQVRDFSALTWDINPHARFGFWTWAVWRYERKHDYSLRGRLLPEAARILGDRVGQVALQDSYHGDVGAVPFFDEGRQLGFRTSHFTYQTNIENGYPFLLPLMAFQRKWAGLAQKNRIDEAFLMLMQVASRYPTGHFGAEYYWDASLDENTVAARYALQLAGNLEAAQALQRAFLLLERLTYRGALGLDSPLRDATAMRQAFEDALRLAPESRREDLRWLVTTARAYEKLFQAADARNRRDADTFEALRRAYVQTLGEDPLFQPFAAEHAARSFDPFVAWLANGFQNGYF